MSFPKIAKEVPEVGLWWYYKGHVLKFPEPYNEATDQDDFFCTKQEHVKVWENIRERSSFKYGIGTRLLLRWTYACRIDL